MKSLVIYALATGGCVSIVPFPSQIQALEDSDAIEIMGVIKVADEIVIYDSAEGRDLELVYPYCISGTGGDEVFQRALELQNSTVRIRGTRHDVEDLESAAEGEFLEAGRKLKGRPVTNWCHGRYVIYLTSITKAE